MAGKEIFHFVMIKPTHYGDDGYPIRYWKSLIPSNTLAAINALVEDAMARDILGPDVEIRPHVYDETNSRIRPDRIIRQIRREGGRALIGFTGVQTNQFPRSVDLAQPFLKAGLPVIIGGFHVSGCMAMLKELPPEIREAQEMGIHLFCGEAEDGRLDGVIRDAWNGTLKPVYNYMDDLPNIAGEPAPFLDRKILGRILEDFSSFDLGRGCPYQCSFCTIINVQGRKSRFRSADDLEEIVRRNAAQGINRFFITDDDLARNKQWEAFFDRLIWLREEKNLPVDLFIQVDTQCHHIPNFIEKACRAGVTRAFVGLENINPDNLIFANKRQNKITDYRIMMQQWREHRVTIYAGYIIGFPADTKESVLRDVEIVKRELPVDVLEFFFLTPLPGSADHKKMVDDGVWMDPDMNKYDVFHRVTHHPVMSDEEWEEAYHAAWESFFSWEHVETVSRRAVGRPKNGANADEIYEFYMSYKLENLHPLEGGVLRLRARNERRPGLPKESPLVFYPRFAWETVVKGLRYGWGYYQAKRLHKRIHAGPDKHSYQDLATTPPTAEEYENLSLYRETAGGAAAVKRQKVLKGGGEVPGLRQSA